nr:unnamed protein product [Digitaria exilis]
MTTEASTDRMNDNTVTTTTENAADLGLPAPSSLLTRTLKYHVSRHSITADASESLKKVGKPENACHENPVHVSLHRWLVTMYTNWATTMTHQLTLSISDAPSKPSPNL